jgi:hypothetical protein
MKRGTGSVFAGFLHDFPQRRIAAGGNQTGFFAFVQNGQLSLGARLPGRIRQRDLTYLALGIETLDEARKLLTLVGAQLMGQHNVGGGHGRFRGSLGGGFGTLGLNGYRRDCQCQKNSSKYRLAAENRMRGHEHSWMTTRSGCEL